MGLNTDCVGISVGPTSIQWDDRDTLLYNVAVGAGLQDHLAELQFTTENSIDVELMTIPTMSGTLGRAVQLVRPHVGDFPSGIHARQRCSVRRPLPAGGEIDLNVKVTGLYDLGRSALLEITSTGMTGDVEQFTNIAEIYIPGEGGFGGSKPAKPAQAFTDRLEGMPVHEVEVTIPADQALVYRLTGDRNPLHADPKFAQKMGFEEPILHGMCTYGFAARLAIQELFDGDATKLMAFSGKFTKPVYPGDAITVRVWEDQSSDGGNGHLFQVYDSSGDVVISEGYINHPLA